MTLNHWTADPLGRPDLATRTTSIRAGATTPKTGSAWPTRTGSMQAALDSPTPASVQSGRRLTGP